MKANKTKHQARVTEWTGRVRKCRGSDMSVKAWCAEQGINPATYYYWEREVLSKAGGGSAKRSGNQTNAETSPAFVELPRLPEAAVNKEEVGSHGRVVAEVESAKGVIRIYEGANAAVIRALCGAALC